MINKHEQMYYCENHTNNETGRLNDINISFNVDMVKTSESKNQKEKYKKVIEKIAGETGTKFKEEKDMKKIVSYEIIDGDTRNIAFVSCDLRECKKHSLTEQQQTDIEILMDETAAAIEKILKAVSR